MATAVRDSLEKGDEDVLAIAYEYIVSGVNRRQLGTFFTPAPIVRYMVNQSRRLLAGPPRYVVDPGAGVGAFTLAALSAWRRASVTAVDVNVVTLGLLAARAAVREAKSQPKVGRLTFAPADYLAWLQEEWPGLESPRLILGNPPYTRHQRMTEKDKQAARKIAGDLITSGLAGLSAYFLAATLNALGPKDAVCFLLPASWCEARYGREIRQWLWEARRRRVEAHFFPSELEVFPGTQVTAMVLLIGPVKRVDQPFVAQHIDLPADDPRADVAPGRSVEPDRTGSCPATFTSLLRRPAPRTVLATVALGEVAKIRRGVATGASEFFFVSDAQRDEHRLPSNSMRRALVKPAHCTGVRLDVRAHDALGLAGLPRWLLDLNGSELAETDERVAAYLDRGRELGIDTRHLTSHRPTNWYKVEPVQAPDLFLVPVGKPFHRVIINDAAAVASNNLYGIYLSEDAPWSKEALARWLRSEDGQRPLAELARHYHGGSLKIEPKSLRWLRVPQGLETPHS
ncbi:Eco57I restriction-modification methylase domain-containing protein [Micromonospora antibiotica]|uniref:site-specific DNA-methyltransferase (adenine-specific) n=1 Tax=Micromonospora antibiotica TaxID=2807623 RepID=A0ABS3V861_9ACTN|nr:Eco57I restriction-modification methylase domain-containing protein [Micromonospora antibiotica]MBO4161717.1 Eco57I restriction-modification methylase domain-containing protein [Micromonospora antibiotica]